MWSFGVLLYRLLSGAVPFNAENQKELFDKVKVGKYKMVRGRLYYSLRSVPPAPVHRHGCSCGRR